MSLQKPSSRSATTPPALEKDAFKPNPNGTDSDSVEDGEEATPEARPSKRTIFDLPWFYSVPAIICVLLLPAGSNWAGSAMPPLKSIMRKDLDITNAQYGVLASANKFVNTLVPILSGMAIDYFGPEVAALVCATFVFVGSVIGGAGASMGKYGVIVGGEVILGLGSTTLETCQNVLYTHWFHASHLGLIFGLDIAVGAITNTVSRVTSVPITENTGSWAWSFWVSCILCGANLLMVIAYFFWARSLPTDLRTPTLRKTASFSSFGESPTGRKWSWMSLTSLPASFWIIVISQILQSGTIGAFSSNSADMIKQTRGTTDLIAGYTSAVNQVIPIVVTPFLGFVFDRFGRRMHFVAFTAALYVLVFSLMGFTDVHPLVPMVLASFALSLNSLPFINAIALLVGRQELIGTAFGVWKSINNAGSIIMDISTGAIQDRTPLGPDNYNRVFYFLIAMKSIDVIYGLGYHWLDITSFGGVLRQNEKRQRAVEVEKETAIAEGRPREQLPLMQSKTTFSYVGLSILAAMIVTALVLYIVYSLGN